MANKLMNDADFLEAVVEHIDTYGHTQQVFAQYDDSGEYLGGCLMGAGGKVLANDSVSEVLPRIDAEMRLKRLLWPGAAYVSLATYNDTTDWCDIREDLLHRARELRQ